MNKRVPRQYTASVDPSKTPLKVLFTSHNLTTKRTRKEPQECKAKTTTNMNTETNMVPVTTTTTRMRRIPVMNKRIPTTPWGETRATTETAPPEKTQQRTTNGNMRMHQNSKKSNYPRHWVTIS